MDDSTWKFIKCNGCSYLVRRRFSVEKFEVQLTNHKRLWSAEGTASDLLRMSQKENPLCEFGLSTVTKNIFNVFDKNLDSITIDFRNDENSKILKISTRLGNHPFNLIWALCEQGPDALYEEVTQPLLYLAEEMGRRCNYLCKEISEISEYVLENPPLKWGRVKTEKFNLEEFKNQLFPYYQRCDPLEAAWEDDHLLAYFNKNALGDKKTEEDHNNKGSPKQNEIIIKQGETATKDDDHIEQPKLEVSLMKKEKDEASTSSITRPKRRKKLNL